MSVKTEGILAGFTVLLVMCFYEICIVIHMIFSVDRAV